MLSIKRSLDNPILRPNKDNEWEAEAAFNPSVIEKNGVIHMVYRAVSGAKNQSGATFEVSSVGHATSRDGAHFKNREQLIAPEYAWEKFGCEDPRITEFEGRYFIFYTALSEYPFSASGIKVGLGITSDFKHIEKHPVTTFNAKAMALFPKRIGGKIAAILTVNTDRPPVKICRAFFDRVEDIWSESYWDEWYRTLERHVLPIECGEKDHIEAGAPPLETDKGWLLVYSYTYNYHSPPAVFGVQAVLLGLNNLQKIVGEVKRPFLIPDEEYEHYGKVPNIVFPSGALVRKKNLFLYYGAADTTSCLAKLNLPNLLEQLLFVTNRQLSRFEGNPIVAPIAEHAWESKATFNPGAIYEGGRVSLIYRAMSNDDTSTLGFASSADGIHFDERLSQPVYVPRESFEEKLQPGNSGCEDPRLTVIEGVVYMCYTAFDGKNPPRVALTSIALTDFLARKWTWARPRLISPPGIHDKDAALFPKKIGGRYAVLHRAGGTNIFIDFLDDLEFKNGRFLGGEALLTPRETAWDSARIGIAGPPIETKKGWLLLYHGISKRSSRYSVRVALLDLNDPTKVLYRTRDSVLEPKMPYEKEGIVANVVFPCGAVVIKNELFVYYGGADKVIGVATIELNTLMGILLHEAKFHKK